MYIICICNYSYIVFWIYIWNILFEHTCERHCEHVYEHLGKHLYGNRYEHLYEQTARRRYSAGKRACGYKHVNILTTRVVINKSYLTSASDPHQKQIECKIPKDTNI